MVVCNSFDINMNCAKSCENLLNFVKVMPKILLVPFFRDTVYMFIMSRTASRCQHLISSAFLSFFWGCQKSALIAILKTHVSSVSTESFNSQLII